MSDEPISYTDALLEKILGELHHLRRMVSGVLDEAVYRVARNDDTPKDRPQELPPAPPGWGSEGR